jgi:hypothetical protein
VTQGKKFQCFTLEDEARTVKVFGETRIPAGRYTIKIKAYGGFHNRYTKRFGAFHRGMLHITDVPGFTDVLLHIGNDDDDTAGCLLVGTSARENVVKAGLISDSTRAYKRIYEKIIEELLAGEEVFINYIDYDDDVY